jgi:hypothetical protein
MTSLASRTGVNRLILATLVAAGYVFASGAYTTFAALDTWIELTLDLTEAQTMVSGFVANDIRQIGVQFDTGDRYEGGTFTTPVDSVFHIDSITAP